MNAIVKELTSSRVIRADEVGHTLAYGGRKPDLITGQRRDVWFPFYVADEYVGLTIRQAYRKDKRKYEWWQRKIAEDFRARGVIA